MPAQGFCLEVTYTGPGQGAFYVDDIHDAFDARNQRVNSHKPGPIYLHPGVPAELIYTSDVAKSFESGKLRVLIEEGRMTSQFRMGEAIGSALGFQQFDVDTATDPVLVMETSGRVVADTTTGAAFVYLPPILDGSAMAPVEIIVTGVNPVTIYPAPGTSDEVIGGGVSIYILDPLVETSITLSPDSAAHIWRRTA